MSDGGLIASFPGLTQADLAAAWQYHADHRDEVDAQRRRHEEAD